MGEEQEGHGLQLVKSHTDEAALCAPPVAAATGAEGPFPFLVTHFDQAAQDIGGCGSAENIK